MNPDLFDRRPLVLAVLSIILLYWQIVFTNQFTFLDAPDQAYQVLPWYQMQARAWSEGYFPMWDPYQWAGQPLIGQMQPGAAFPLNWPLFAAPLKDGKINQRYVHWHFVFMHILAGLFMYALARKLHRSRYASLIAAVGFSSTGFLGSVHWPQMLNGAVWIPLMFLLFHRSAEAEETDAAIGWAALCGGVVGVAILSGHHQTPFFSLLALTGLFAYFLYRKKQESLSSSLRFVGLYLLVAGFAFLVGALQLIPAVEYGQEAYRWVGAKDPVTMGWSVPYYLQYESRLNAVALLGAVIPFGHLGVNTFVGFLGLGMALYSVASSWNERWVRVYACLAAGALAYSFGPFSVLHGWIYSFVPYADKARTPSHAIFVFQFALFLLAAHGIDRFLSFDRDEAVCQRWLTYLRRGLLGFALLATLFLFHQFVEQEVEVAPGDQVMVAVLVAILLAALLHARSKQLLSWPALRGALFLLLVFEVGTTKWFDLPHRDAPREKTFLSSLSDRKGAMEFLKAQPGPFRFEMSDEEGQPNLGDWEGVEAVDGYLASVSKDLFDFLLPDWSERRLMLNTVYSVAKKKSRQEQIEVYSDSSGWKVFRNPDAFPRGWVEHDLAEISPGESPEEPLPQPESCSGDEPVSIQRQTIHKIVANARLQCRGYIIFGEPYFPGWEATINGQAATIHRAYGALRALAAPAGEHTIEFNYRPRSVYWGGALTACGFLGCIGLATMVLWRKRSSGSP